MALIVSVGDRGGEVGSGLTLSRKRLKSPVEVHISSLRSKCSAFCYRACKK